MTESDFVTRVVKAVAAADGVDTADLDSIYEYINPEVLTNLYNQERGEWSFTFLYSDHQVTITHDAKIIVDGRVHTQDALMGYGDMDDID